VSHPFAFSYYSSIYSNLQTYIPYHLGILIFIRPAGRPRAGSGCGEKVFQAAQQGGPAKNLYTRCVLMCKKKVCPAWNANETWNRKRKYLILKIV
jgi:hypothetical protein